MKLVFAFSLFAAPALAQDVPFAVGDSVVLSHLMDPWTGEVTPNPLPDTDRACLRIETISQNDIWLRVEAGYFDMNTPPNPLFANQPTMEMPTQAPIGTGMGFSSSTSIWLACQESTLLTTASTTCDMQRLFEPVPDCSGRPLPPN